MTEQPHNWLDTETKACLQRNPPVKLAPPTTDAFTVVVLHRTRNVDGRGLGAFQSAFGLSRESAQLLCRNSLPFVAQHGLTRADAMLAQFELICSDIISVFIADNVVSQASPDYLTDLYKSLIGGSEFSTVHVAISGIPDDEHGNRFSEKFLGRRPESFPHKMIATFKKGRVMRHWATKIGAVVSIDQQ